MAELTLNPRDITEALRRMVEALTRLVGAIRVPAL